MDSEPLDLPEVPDFVSPLLPVRETQKTMCASLTGILFVIENKGGTPSTHPVAALRLVMRSRRPQIAVKMNANMGISKGTEEVVEYSRHPPRVTPKHGSIAVPTPLTDGVPFPIPVGTRDRTYPVALFWTVVAVYLSGTTLMKSVSLPSGRYVVSGDTLRAFHIAGARDPEEDASIVTR